MIDKIEINYDADIIRYRRIPFIQYAYILFIIGIVLSLFKESEFLYETIGLSQKSFSNLTTIISIIAFFGILTSNFSNTLYYITGQFTFNQENFKLIEESQELEIKWSEVETVRLKKKSRQIYELLFNDSNVFLKLDKKEAQELKSILKE